MRNRFYIIIFIIIIIPSFEVIFNSIKNHGFCSESELATNELNLGVKISNSNLKDWGENHNNFASSCYSSSVNMHNTSSNLWDNDQ